MAINCGWVKRDRPCYVSMELVREKFQSKIYGKVSQGTRSQNLLCNRGICLDCARSSACAGLVVTGGWKGTGNANSDRGGMDYKWVGPVCYSCV